MHKGRQPSLTEINHQIDADPVMIVVFKVKLVRSKDGEKQHFKLDVKTGIFFS
jgi:hypothetical protein